MLFSNIHHQAKRSSFSSTRTRARGSHNYQLENLNSRLAAKIERGERLNRVEKHLARSLKSSIAGSCFGPSIVSSFAQILAAMGRPIAFLLLVAFIVAAEGRSAAWFSDRQVVEQELFIPLTSNTDISEIELAVARTRPLNDRQRAEMLSFITGVIAVYYPGLNNSAEVARNIVQLSADAGVDPLYVASVISVESGFRIKARSSVGARGLMQLLPRTAEEVSQQLGGHYSHLRLNDPETNIALGIEYLKRLEGHYNGNRFLSLAAYNWGMGNLDKSVKRGKPMPKAVKKYASTILERTLRWQKHFERAEAEANKLGAV